MYFSALISVTFGSVDFSQPLGFSGYRIPCSLKRMCVLDFGSGIFSICSDYPLAISWKVYLNTFELHMDSGMNRVNLHQSVTTFEEILFDSSLCCLNKNISRHWPRCSSCFRTRIHRRRYALTKIHCLALLICNKTRGKFIRLHVSFFLVRDVSLDACLFPFPFGQGLFSVCGLKKNHFDQYFQPRKSNRCHA